LTPPFIVLAIAIINTTKIETEWEMMLKSVGSLAMWLKLLYFCRIYKHTGYLIRTIVKVVQGMTTFLMVLAITVVAVGDA
jgi:ABC-type iron transport system FetAB permease component